MKEVAIVLATYNGGKYLREQLDSILNQTYKNIKVYIHDDKSNDNTLSIIHEYELKSKYSCKIKLISSNSLGYPECFINTLVSIPKSDYYAFCDQDDVWNNTKIENAVKAIEKHGDEGVASLFYSAVDYYDGNLNYVRKARFVNKHKPVVSVYTLQELLLGGEAMGMTFLFNNKVRDVFLELASNGTADFKDTFIKIYCASCGKVIYSYKPCAKYRRHSEATTVRMNPSGKMQRLINMSKKIFIDVDGMESIQTSVNYIKDNYYSRVLDDNKKLIDTFSAPNSFGKRIKKVLWTSRFRLKIIDEIGYRLAFLIGRI